VHITKPHHSESRTIWCVHDAESCVATLEIGKRYRSEEGAEYKLIDVFWHTGYVRVNRTNDSDVYLWRIESLVNSHMKEIDGKE